MAGPYHELICAWSIYRLIFHAHYLDAQLLGAETVSSEFIFIGTNVLLHGPSH